MHGNCNCMAPGFLEVAQNQLVFNTCFVMYNIRAREFKCKRSEFTVTSNLKWNKHYYCNTLDSQTFPNIPLASINAIYIDISR